MELVFPMLEDSGTGKQINRQIAEEACLEVTELIKVLKTHYASYEYVDEHNGNKLVKYNILLFNFESYCFSMYDFCKLFYVGLEIIIGGYKEYHKLYDEIKSTLSETPIGFRNLDSDNTNEKSQPIDKHGIGFV